MMLTEEKKLCDEATREVERTLREAFANNGMVDAEVEAYRPNSSSIRVRVVHPSFRGKTATERDEMTAAFFAQLPEKLDQQITLVLMLTPLEKESEFMNQEFDNPSLTWL